MAAAAVDVGYLSTHLGVPEANLNIAVTEPTVDLVKAILDAVATKAHEFDTLYSEKLRVDIEFESAVRSAEARSESFKTAAETSRKEVEDLRRKLQDEENARRAVENELQTLKSSGSNTQAEIERLASRNASLEASNRDTLAILESKTSANAELAEELQTQHQKTLKLNQEITALQQTLETAQAAVVSAKFREQSLQQELDFARKNNEWFETELKTKSEESLKFRKEKGARIADLERRDEEAQSTIAALTRTETQLRTRLEDAQRKADDALAHVQQLQEAAARSEESFRAELESSARLVELKEQQTETHRHRLREVELRLEQVKDESAGEVRRVRQEMEQVKEDLHQADQRAQDLEAEVDRLQAMLSTPAVAAPAPPGSAPQTPRANGGPMALLRGASPFGTPGSVLRSKSSITAAQAMEELYKTKGELARERRRTQELGQELDEIMTALEAKGPELADLQEEAERLRSENIQISRLCEESFSERDAAKKLAKKAESASITAQAEIEILRTQLRDLSTQIQLLVFNIQAREKGLDELTEEELDQFQRLQKGQVAEGALDDMSDTHQFISERFVVFKDIQELQEKNAELLRITRELATKMESDEASEAKRQQEQDQAELKHLRETVARLQDESKSVLTRMKSYMTERDMFRRMLQQKATPAEISSALGDATQQPSADGSQRGVLASIEQHSGPSGDEDLTVALRELQNNFDAYRNEQGIDRQTIRAQVEKLSNERSALHAEIARLSSQLTLASERYEMLQSNYAALETDNKALQEKNQTLSESNAKQDMRTQQVAMDLVEVRSLLESMRSENANLKAEKTLWKGIQDRLVQDNESLNGDRARLNSLLTSQQNLLNERELAEAETKRRLQNQIDNLETELTTTKRKLSEEIEDAKKLQLRKEYDAQQAQKRIDDLMATIAQSREELVATKTTRDHLQARVNELTMELRNAEERMQRLQPRPTPRTPAQQQQSQQSQQSDEGIDGENADARLQELEDEAASLRRDLELARSELENSKAEAASYKDIAQAMEEDLREQIETHEKFRAEIEAEEAGKNEQIEELKRQLEAVKTELAETERILNGLRASQAEVVHKAEDEKRILESEIARLRDSEERYKEEKKYHQSDLRAQADIAARAQKDYEQELVKHAEAAKLLQALRSEHNNLRTEAATWRAEAEAAKVTLSQSEASWEERRQQFEQELQEVKARRDDTNAQNKLLGQQLESVAAQIASLQQSRSSVGGGGGGGSDEATSTETATPTAVADTATEGLRELNNYLRREKEILEVQYNLKLQENQRLQQKLDYATTQLDEARLKLEQERRSQADVSRSSQTHKELMEKLNELNLIRESNVTLRNDNVHAQGQLAQKESTIQALRAQMAPLEQRVAELENQKLFLDEEVKQIAEDRDRWQKRTESILTKYGRVDATELDQLKQTVTALETERAALQETEAALRARVQELEASLETDRNQWRESRQKLIDQAKEKARQQGALIREVTAQKNELQEQAAAATQQLASVEAALASATAAKTALEGRVAVLEQQVQQASLSSGTAADGAVSSFTPMAIDEPQQQQQQQQPTDSLPTQDNTPLQQPQEDVDQLRGELEAVRTDKAAVDQELVSLRAQLADAVRERDEALAQLQQQQQQQQQQPQQQQQQAAHDDAQAEEGEWTEGAAVNGARADGADGTDGAPAPAPASAAEADAVKQALEQRVAEAEARAAAFEQKAKQVEDNIQAILKERSDKMKDALNRRLKEAKEKGEQELREAKEKQEAELALRFEQEKQIWAAEHASAAGAGGPTATVPTTPAKIETKVEGLPAGAAATTPSTPVDLSKLGDAETRELLSNNPTVRSIVTANIKKKMETEMRKVREEVEQVVKGEFEAKVTSAREAGQMMAEKKTSIRINMAENRLRAATAKIEVVATAAQETPQRPVGEVWAVAKDARPAPPATPAAPTPAAAAAAASAAASAAAAAGPTATPAGANNATPTPAAVSTADASKPAVPATPATPTVPAMPATPSTPTPNQPGPAANRSTTLPAKPQQQQQQPPKMLPAVANNPFNVKPGQAAAPNLANPFAKGLQQLSQQQQQPPPQQQQQQQQQQAQRQQPAGAHQAQPTQQGPQAQARQAQAQQAQAQQAQQQQQQRSGIPVPGGGGRGGGAHGNRGGGRGGGVYQAPRGGRGGRGGAAGAGGSRGGGAAGGGAGAGAMNPAADTFNPGNKRPRNDGEGGANAGGGGPKRIRGGGGGGGGGQAGGQKTQ